MSPLKDKGLSSDVDRIMAIVYSKEQSQTQRRQGARATEGATGGRKRPGKDEVLQEGKGTGEDYQGCWGDKA